MRTPKEAEEEGRKAAFNDWERKDGVRTPNPYANLAKLYGPITAAWARGYKQESRELESK